MTECWRQAPPSSSLDLQYAWCLRKVRAADDCRRAHRSLRFRGRERVSTEIAMGSVGALVARIEAELERILVPQRV